MKRKEFVRNISLIGAGIALAPIKLFSAESGIKTYRLPTPTVHIPHGNYAGSEVEYLEIQEMGLTVSTEKFLRNGVSRSEMDIKVLTLRKGDDLLMISLGKKMMIEGHIQGISVKHVSKTGLEISDQSYRFRLQEGTSFVQLQRTS